MPCICWGALSGEQAYDAFLNTREGQDVMKHLKAAAFIIKNTDISYECKTVEFKKLFVTALHHMLVGCDEGGKPSL